MKKYCGIEKGGIDMSYKFYIGLLVSLCSAALIVTALNEYGHNASTTKPACERCAISPGSK